MLWRFRASATNPEAFISSTKPPEVRSPRRLALGHAHGLIDDHEATRQQAEAAQPLGVRLELLLDARRHIEVIGEEVVHDLG
jgi:predicted ATPase